MASRLSLLSDNTVTAVAAFDISKSLDLYDSRFGNAGNSDLPCPVCGMRCDVCIGHHASMSLGVHMFHPLVYKESQKIINCTCMGCGNAISIDNSVLKAPRYRSNKCNKCGSRSYSDYVINQNKKQSSNAKSACDDLMFAVRQGDAGNKIHAKSVQNHLPEGYVVSKILIPPIYLRTPEGIEWPTEIQRLYEHLVGAVRSKKRVCLAYSQIVGIQGVIGMMSGKSGIFRQLMMGKRLELSARAVIVGDPYLELDQVAVPKAVAGLVRVKIACNPYNISNVVADASKELLWWPGTDDKVNHVNILEGMEFERTLMDGDIAMLNRQPSLSRVSLMCFKVVIRKDMERVFSINPQITPPFNADFDGDEMNIFFMSNRAEMTGLCSVSECDNLLPVQDVVTGCYLMSEKNAAVSDGVWSDCVMHAKSKGIDVPDNQTTFGLLSMCIQGYDGSRLHKRDFGRFKRVRTHLLQLVVERWLQVHGLTVSLKSLHVATPVTKGDRETTDAFKERCITVVKLHMSGTGIMSMIDSGAKGSVVHASHMAVSIGQQHIGGKNGVFCNRSYASGLTPNEFFGHQMAAREGVVSTGISTASTGYLNRRACKIIADLKLQYNGIVSDANMVSSFSFS